MFKKLSGSICYGITVLIFAICAINAAEQPEDDFDRLDGRGPSGKRVDVIEWAGNLEIHIYPAGSLAGMTLQVDRKSKNKPVMVIGYRFNNMPSKRLVRRNILTIPLQDGFTTYQDKTTVPGGYDKFIITNNALSDKGIVAFNLDQSQKELYPEGHPALAGSAENKKETSDKSTRTIANELTKRSSGGAGSVKAPPIATTAAPTVAPTVAPTNMQDPTQDQPAQTYDKKNGSIQPFQW